jgi:hypothetical protein
VDLRSILVADLVGDEEPLLVVPVKPPGERRPDQTRHPAGLEPRLAPRLDQVERHPPPYLSPGDPRLELLHVRDAELEA